MNQLDAIPDGYYAVPDPRDTNQQTPTMTYWHAHNTRYGRTLDMWPAKAKYGPLAYRKDRPKDPAEAVDWMRRHSEKRRAWNELILTEIARNPDRCRARFAALATRCTWCGRTLTDDKSKLLGYGPDCRRALKLDDEALAATITPLIAAAHATQETP